MDKLVLIADVIIAATIIALVLLQQGKGASMGASFGSGTSNTVFGSRGSSSFMFKLTAVLTVLFFGLSLTLGYLSKHGANKVLLKKTETNFSQEAYNKQHQKLEPAITPTKAKTK